MTASAARIVFPDSVPISWSVRSAVCAVMSGENGGATMATLVVPSASYCFQRVALQQTS